MESSGQSHSPKLERRQVTTYLFWVYFPICIVPPFSHPTRFTIRAGTQAELPTGPACVVMSFDVQSWLLSPLFSKRCKDWKNWQQTMHAPPTLVIPRVTFAASHGLRMLTKLTRTAQQKEEGRKAPAFPIQ